MNEKPKSRGRMRISHLFSADELGIAIPEPHTKRAIRIFLDLASDDEHTAVIARATEMRNAVLLFQTVESVAESGYIYIYDRCGGNFYAVEFDGGKFDGFLTLSDYENLVAEYNLLDLVASPHLLPTYATA